ncbi:MAG: hypothetical protein ACRDHD_03780 [Candidatus Limnocylindria bacterium]
MSDIQYVYPLIHNKVTSPHYVTPTLRRARLIDWLNASAECRAVVVAADAGYGKTTLLWQWEREVDFPCYWYKLDRNDRDWSLHISYLIEAISQRHPGFGRRAHSMLQQLGGPGSSRPGVAAYLLAEMHERLTEPCTFIIDDWQFVASVTEVRGLWNQILRDAPPTCRFVFLSRAKPHLQFARFKTHAGYAEIRTDALRFTDREIDELFRDIYNDPLDPTELAELERRTEGWAASLQLVEVSLRERRTPEERRAFIQSITATSDSDLFAFLAEEVLDQQDQRIREFLLSTSILHHIDPELAERLAGIQDGARMLADLEHRGLFTYELGTGGGSYRYHGLFREFLERRLLLERTEGEVTGLHIHAASYYETSQEWPSAIHHYLRAGLQPQAARLIARYGEDVASEGRLGLIDEWLDQLPSRAVRDNSRLSLLLGEAKGIRGEWAEAIAAIGRAKAYFSRKGDRRMEALASLKLSTVYANRGEVALAAETASAGLRLAPEDADATRLRLRGNMTITAAWMESQFEDVLREFRRIAVEAKSRGWEHFASIALHNMGVAQRHVGQLEESVRNLELAARFWSGLPASPFADNAELVASLLAVGQSSRAAMIAETAVIRTEPWARPHAEALYGRALVAAHEGKFGVATDALYRILQEPRSLGPTAELVTALLVECLHLSGNDGSEERRLMEALPAEADPRLEPIMIPARAIAVHSGACRGECLDERERLRVWEARGAQYSATLGLLKLATLAMEHGGARNLRFAREAIIRARDQGLLRVLRWWLRQFLVSAESVANSDEGAGLVAVLAESDPDGWRDRIVSLLREAAPGRPVLLTTITRIANKQTMGSLMEIGGADVAEARRKLAQSRASRLFARSFGSVVIHRASWDGPTIAVDRRRTRNLLGLLIAHAGATLTRDMVLDVMWPDADPGAAVNSLNQTVFQLRRAIDPDYRDGESPQYIVSNVDVVQFNPDLVRTDLEEARRLAERLRGPSAADAREAAVALIALLRGEFLAELRYEDWASRLQTSVHSEIRDMLMPLAIGSQFASPDLSIRAASALVELDQFDDEAYVAMATHLAASGRHKAARELIASYARRVQDEFSEAPSVEISTLLHRLERSQSIQN